MRTPLISQMMSGLLLFIDTSAAQMSSQAAVAFPIRPGLAPTTKPGILSSQNTTNRQIQGQPASTTQGHPMVSPTGQGNASAEYNPIIGDGIAVPTSSAAETNDSITDSIPGEKASVSSSAALTNSTDVVGFIVPPASPDVNGEEASHTTSYLSAGPASWLGAPSNSSDPLGPSDVLQNSSTVMPPHTIHSGHEETDGSRTSSAAAVISSQWIQKISGYETGLKNKAQLKGPGLREKKTVSGKMLALFLGVAGLLVCLLIVIYVIYSRTHKSELFSHHRLYGEGFEDPVLHLDTPMDHYDFFSFSDTHEHSPRTLQQLRNARGEAPPPTGTPAGSSTHEHQREVIQMESLTSWARNKNFV